MIPELTSIREANKITAGLLFGYTTDEIDSILDRVEASLINMSFGC